jgi:hypothetical protein
LLRILLYATNEPLKQFLVLIQLLSLYFSYLLRTYLQTKNGKYPTNKFTVFYANHYDSNVNIK